MAENHITVQINQTDLNDLAAVVNADEESHDLPGHINGQPVVVRFRAEEVESEIKVVDTVSSDDLLHAAADLLDEDSQGSEYARAILELLADTILRSEDVYMDERREHVRNLIRQRRA